MLNSYVMLLVMHNVAVERIWFKGGSGIIFVIGKI